MFAGVSASKSLVRSTGLDDRGVKRRALRGSAHGGNAGGADRGGLHEQSARSKKIYDPAWRRQTAKAIVEGIQNYRQIVEL
jgi:N-acetylmuramoyl-L-alanine amidase